VTDLNQYLRRADVEALLDAKIAALNLTVAEQTGITSDRTIGESAMRIAQATRRDAVARVDAICTVKEQLGMCQQFTYRTFREYGDAGKSYNSLVAADADRVPLDPVDVDMDVAA